MGLWLKKEVGANSYLGLWRIAEDEAFFTQQLELQAVEQEELDRLKGQRRLEWLASRWLVHEMLVGHGHEDRVPLRKDEFGKPHLEGTGFQLSFSHSHGVVAVLISDRPTGIDVQAIVPKIETLARKFMREEELASLSPATRLLHIHYYWGAKEALYKAHGRRQLDFRQHILVAPFPFEALTQTKGLVSKDGEQLPFTLFFELLESHVLVYALLAD